MKENEILFNKDGKVEMRLVHNIDGTSFFKK